MLDKDLAMLYGVEAKVLNQAVKRNVERFPNDFRFQLTKEECLRSQIVTLNEKQGQHLKYMPYAFTEQGVAMLIVFSVHKQLLRLIFGNNKELTCKDRIVYENIEYSHIKEKRDNT